MTNEENLQENMQTEEIVETQYVDENGNPIDPSLIDENGNYIGTTTQYVDENGNPIDPSLIDENGNYIGAVEDVATEGEETDEVTTISAGANQMAEKSLFTGMVTFDYNNVPITDIVNSIILDAINKGASDIHFDPFDEGIKIRIRIDGLLNDYSIVPLYVKKNMITRIKIISGMNITESRIPQDGAIRTELADKTVDLRVSCLPTNLGEKIVIRIMDYSMTAAGIDALDFSEPNLEKVKKMLAAPNGIILVTGATGTGKSTTVYSMLQVLNVEGKNLITVEDPIEMNIGGVNQVQANSEIGLDFATVLRSILRQDPDVIMIGEIRDDETARIAVRASITGHLVLSTIHTNNSLSTIERLTDMSVERYLLGTALEGIVSQKLSRRLCPKCKQKKKASDYEKSVIKRALNIDIDELYEPVGCDECQKGYRGRIAIHEVLLVTQQLRDAIIKGVEKSELRKTVYGKLKTITMLEDGLQKVVDGYTTIEEILKLIDLEDDLGNGSQLGLEDQLDAASLNNEKDEDKKEAKEETKKEEPKVEEKKEEPKKEEKVENTPAPTPEPVPEEKPEPPKEEAPGLTQDKINELLKVQEEMEKNKEPEPAPIEMQTVEVEPTFNDHAPKRMAAEKVAVEEDKEVQATINEPKLDIKEDEIGSFDDIEINTAKTDAELFDSILKEYSGEDGPAVDMNSLDSIGDEPAFDDKTITLNYKDVMKAADDFDKKKKDKPRSNKKDKAEEEDGPAVNI